MTYEIILSLMVVLMVTMCFLVAIKCAYEAGKASVQTVTAEAKPQPAAVDEKAKKEAEKRQRNKALIDEAQEEMDKAVRDFISRGGLPK